MVGALHDDVIKWKHFPRYWPLVWGIHRSPINSPHKGQWRGALMFSLICAWIRSGNNPDRGTSPDRETAPNQGTLHLDRRWLIRIKAASGKHLFLWYNSNCDWQRCIGIPMMIWAIFITSVTPFKFMGLSLTTWQSGCPFQKEWKPYISSHIFNLMATCDDKQYFQLTANLVI